MADAKPPYFYLAFYRRQKYPGENTKKPLIIIQFWEVPENPGDRFWERTA